MSDIETTTIYAMQDEARVARIVELEAEVARLERHRDALFNAGDRVCGEAMQMTVSVPRKQAEQADKLEEAVNKFRAACLNRAALAGAVDIFAGCEAAQGRDE